MFGSTASRGDNCAKVGGATGSQERGLTRQEGYYAGEKEETITLTTKNSKGIPQEKIKKDEVQNQIKLRGAEGCKSGDGETDAEKKEKIEGVEEDIGPSPPPVL